MTNYVIEDLNGNLYKIQYGGSAWLISNKEIGVQNIIKLEHTNREEEFLLDSRTKITFFLGRSVLFKGRSVEIRTGIISKVYKEV